MIRPALVLLLAAPALVPVPLTAQSTFEGTVTMTITGANGATHSVSYMLKDGKLRFDPGGAGRSPVTVIIDPATQTLVLIMTGQRMYMERSFSAVADTAQEELAAKHPKAVRTGRMDTVAGYKCEHVTVTDDDGAMVDSCVSFELGGFRMPAASNPMAPQREPGWISQLGRGAFPLKVEKGGHVIMQVTSIEKKNLDAALFAPPAGFQAISMPRPRKPGHD